MPVAELSAQRKMDRGLQQLRTLLHQAVERLRDVPDYLLGRLVHGRERTMGQGRGLER
jgi:hypothetical protein